jgi:hypothetical protein
MRHKEAKKAVEKVGLIVAAGFAFRQGLRRSGIDLFFVSETPP